MPLPPPDGARGRPAAASRPPARGDRPISGLRGGARRQRLIRLRYGPSRSQRADLWLPSPASAATASAGSAAVPVVVLLHGGFWRWPYSKMIMTILARDVRARGWAAWNVEYRRLGRFGGGGGHPATFDDVAAAVDHLAALPASLRDRVDLTRVVLCGHSAGGTLALWAAGRRDCPVVPRAVIGLAAVSDLAVAERTGIGGSAVSDLLGGQADERPDRYAACSPSSRVPSPVPVILVHGRTDDTVPLAMSEEHVHRERAAGGTAELVVVEATHSGLLRPRGPGWQSVIRAVTTISELSTT